jgi:hypothetical protein
MGKHYILRIILLFFVVIIFSCSKSNEDEYVELPEVSVNLSTIPYAKLSEYHFFNGPIKDQNPNTNLVPYEPASALFSDYAHKKRFIWLPKNTHANYNGDGNVFEFPV